MATLSPQHTSAVVTTSENHAQQSYTSSSPTSSTIQTAFQKHQSEQSPTKTHTSSNTTNEQKNSQQQFCLRWNNYQTNLTNIFVQLLQTESFVDVTLVCDGGNTIKAHKIMLSACSPYFQGLLFDNPCQHPIIIMHDVKWSELKVIIEFMYKGEINVCQDQIGPLLRVADMLKIRGLSNVNDDHELNVTIPIIQSATTTSTTTTTTAATKTSATILPRDLTATKMKDWNSYSLLNSNESIIISDNKSDREKSVLSHSPTDRSNSELRHHRKRRWASTETCENDNRTDTSTPDLHIDERASAQHTNEKMKNSPNLFQPPTSPTPPNFLIPPSIEALGLSTLMMNPSDEMEIKPEIAEMIREEERAKFMENSSAWLGTPTVADSYQYQLQSMWQKMWSSNHNLKFRERGPLKSWKPETMAEAILSVLKDGLSLSQAARKYDIPYPTFVLYANRVHNMLGPSVEAGIDVRPKGRGRPQRILLGIWPDEHIKGVVKSVVFRDVKELRDEPMQLGFGRDFLMYQPDGQLQYQGLPGLNGFSPSSVNALLQSYKCNETVQSHQHNS